MHWKHSACADMWRVVCLIVLAAAVGVDACDPGLAGPECLPCSTLCNGTWFTCDEETGGDCACMPGHTPASNCTVCDDGYTPAASGRCLPCPSGGCGVHGTCAPPVRDTVRHTARCLCDAGWTYADASDDTSPCTVCVATGGMYAVNATGDDCVACDPLCTSRGTCLPDGVCACTPPTAGPPACTGCAEGYTHHPATGVCEPCVGCAPGANCTIHPGTGAAVCVCPPGRVGAACDACGPVGHAVATANGTCIDCPGDDGCPPTHVCVLTDDGHNATCACPPGWYGPECSVCDADTCAAECSCARRDAGAACIRRIGADSVPKTACRCGVGHTHAVPGDDTSVCRPCGDMETPTRCLTCPDCDAASEQCIEVGQGDATLAVCVCREGWTPVPGWRASGCFPAAVVQVLADAAADGAAVDAAAAYTASGATGGSDRMDIHDVGAVAGDTDMLVAVLTAGVAMAVAGGAVAVAAFRCRANRVPPGRKTQ